MGTIGTVAPAADGGSGAGGLLILALPLLLVVWMFWSQSRRMKQLRAFNDSLQVGDGVVLSSGLFGTVRHLDDSTAHLEIADGIIVKVDRRALAMKQTEVTGAEPTASAGTADDVDADKDQ